MEISKILKNIQNDSEAKKGTVEYELEILEKENCEKDELKCMLKCCQLKLQESNDSMTYVLTIAALVLSVTGNIVSLFSGFEEVNNSIVTMLLQGYLISATIITGLLVVYIICRTIKAKSNDLKLRNKMIAIEMQLAKKEAE